MKLPKGVSAQHVFELTPTTWMLQTGAGQVYHGTTSAQDNQGPLSIEWLPLSSSSGAAFDMRYADAVCNACASLHRTGDASICPGRHGRMPRAQT